MNSKPVSRLLLTALASLLLVALIWLIGSAWLLNSQWLSQRISQIDGVEIRWSAASTLHPGRWEVENLYLARDDSALPIAVDARQATLSLSLLGLLRGELHIQALDAQGIRRLTLGDIALEAEGQLRVSNTQLSRDTLAVPSASLDITQGRLLRLSDQATLVRDINLRTDATLEPVVTTQPLRDELTAALLSALSGTLSINAQADAWDVFMPYLEALPWLTLNGQGALSGELHIANGQFQPSSDLTLDAPALRVTLDEQRLRPMDEKARRWLIADTPPSHHTASGEGRVSLSVEADQLHFSTQLNEVVLADTHPYATHTQLRLATRVPNRRLDQLDLPTDVSVDIQGSVTRLDMLNRYLAHAIKDQAIQLSGSGHIAASATLRDARPYQASLTVQAPALGAELVDFSAQGDGSLTAVLTPDETLSATLALSNATLSHRQHTLLADADITLAARSPLDPAHAQEAATGKLTWENARLPDISVLQGYLDAVLPSPSPFQLLSGQAASRGELAFHARTLSGEIHLAGEQLNTRWQRNERSGTLESDAQLRLTIRRATTDGSALDLSGTRLSWQIADTQAPSERLESTLVLREGRFQNHESLSGEFVMEGSVQRLGFLNALLPAAHGLALAGDGQLFAQGAFHDNRLLAPTRLRVNANQLEVAFLDYLATGRGELTAQLDTAEQAQLSLGIPRFSLRRQGDERPHLEGRHFALTTQTERFSHVLNSPTPQDFTTRIALPITEVPDFTRYNHYLPEEAGIELLGGQASLSSEWLLEGLTAQGAINLRAFGAELALLDQQLRGDVALRLQLTEGNLETRRFTANDSYLRLENVFRQSDSGAQDAGWWVQLAMNEAQLEWDDPMRLTSQLRLSMRDSGLLARLFLARARESDWLGRLLNVRHIDGTAQLRINGEQISLQDVTLTGGSLLLLSDVVLADKSAHGALYAQLGSVGVGVELVDSEPTLRILQPRRWFDRWREAQHLIRP